MLAHRVPAIEMAFMMPVMKNEWDIYKTNRSRRSSECSNPQACRSRKVSVFCALQNEQCLKREQKARAPIAFVVLHPLLVFFARNFVQATDK